MRDVLVYRQVGGYAYLCKINICMHILHVNVPVHIYIHTHIYMNSICVGIHVYVYMCSLVCLCIKFFWPERRWLSVQCLIGKIFIFCPRKQCQRQVMEGGVSRNLPQY